MITFTKPPTQIVYHYNASKPIKTYFTALKYESPNQNKYSVCIRSIICPSKQTKTNMSLHCNFLFE